MNILEYILECSGILTNEQIGELVLATKALLSGSEPTSFSSQAVQVAFMAIKVVHSDSLKQEAKKEAEREQGRKNAKKRWEKTETPTDTPNGDPSKEKCDPINTPDNPLMGCQWGANGAPMGGYKGAITKEEDFSLSPLSPSPLSPTPPISITPISPSTLSEEETFLSINSGEKLIKRKKSLTETKKENEKEKKEDENKGVNEEETSSLENGDKTQEQTKSSPQPPSYGDPEERKREFGMKLKEFTGSGQGKYPRKLINEFFIAWTEKKDDEITFPFERVSWGFDIAEFLKHFEKRYNKKHNINQDTDERRIGKQILGPVNLNDGRKRVYSTPDTATLGPEDFTERDWFEYCAHATLRT